nr:hypothetical protein [Tanacetum cinerariifolium]
KCISQTEAEEAEAAEAARKVHATHARIVTESVPDLLRRKLEATDIMQALKESKKTSIRQPVKELVLNQGFLMNKDITEEQVILEWGDEQDSELSDDDNDDVKKDDKDGDADDEGDDHVSDTQDVDDEDVKTESDEDEIYKYKISVRKDEDVEMKDAEVDDSDKGEEKVTNTTKEKAKKTSEANDDAKKTELPLSSSSLSVSSGFGDQFLKLSFDSSLVSTIKDSTYTNVSSLLDIPIQQETAQTESPSVYKVFVSVIPETTNLPSIPEVVTKIPVSTTHQPELTKKPTPTAKQESKKSSSDILKIKKEQAENQKKPHFTIKTTDKATLEEYDLKSALYQSMHTNKSFNRNPANHRLYHALMEALIEDENAMDKGTKRRRTKEFKSSKKPSSTKETTKGKAPTKGSKTGKSDSAKEPVEEPIAEVVMDDAGDDVARDDNPPQDTSEPKTRKL